MLTRGRSNEMKAMFDRSPEDCSVMDLMARGWTLRLIEVLLGGGDYRNPVDHFRNYSGKKMFYLKKVELAESSDRFENEFKKSARRRKLAPDVQAGVLSRVHELRDNIAAHPEAYTPSEPTEPDRTLREVAEMFAEARKFGYRTPHKC